MDGNAHSSDIGHIIPLVRLDHDARMSESNYVFRIHLVDFVGLASMRLGRRLSFPFILRFTIKVWRFVSPAALRLGLADFPLIPPDGSSRYGFGLTSSALTRPSSPCSGRFF
jgi:hypothetical protein